MRYYPASRGLAIVCLCLLLLSTGCYRALEKRDNATQEVRRQAASAVVKKRLLELFDRCKVDDYAAAAPYIVYRGPDKEREWKDVAHYDQPQEQKGIISVCRRIKRYLLMSDGYDFGRFTVDDESEGVWHVWEVFFKTSAGRETRYFAFLKIKDQYTLGDID